jgi:hypothetical protein
MGLLKCTERVDIFPIKFLAVLIPVLVSAHGAVRLLAEYFVLAALAGSTSPESFDGIAWSTPITYRAKGQSPQKQQRDDGAFDSGARSNTCVDPIVVASAPPPPPEPAVGDGERVRGAAGGAVVGAIAEDAGKGAVIGTTTATMAGGVHARQNRHAAATSTQSQTRGTMDTFNRAHAANMEGRRLLDQMTRSG